MSNSNANTINASEVGVKPQEIKPYPAGAHDTYTAGTVTAQNNTDTQMELIKASGGSKKVNKSRKQTKRRNGGWIKPKRGGSKSKHKRTKRKNGGWIKPKRGGSKSKHKRVRFSKHLVHTKKSKSGGSGGQHVIVPNIHVPYTETGAGNQTVNGVHSQTVHNAAVSHTNSTYDDCVGKTQEQCQISNNDSTK